MIRIEESNPSFESCFKCIHADDSEETCILRRCIHAVAQLKECYVPKQPTAEPERKKGRWLRPYRSGIACECSVCHVQMPVTDDFNFCPNCGAEMTEGEG